jgi:hypothetical protein
MNNATTMRALAAVIVIVVVLIFTTGSLAAATSSSSSTAPQPHSLTCTHPDNNTTCSQEKIISTTQIPLPILQPQSSATLTNIKHVINDIVGTIFVKDFTSSASDSNVSSQSSFPGAQSPGTTTVTLKPGTFPVVLSQQANATTTAVAAADHNKCSSGDIITCTPKETHHPAKDTTPFDLPLPFP